MKCVATIATLVSVLGALSCPLSQRNNILMIDAAPSVVAYQGSGQTYAHLVIAPTGRALGYIQRPAAAVVFAAELANATLAPSELLTHSLRVLDISPVYVHKH